MKTDISIRGTGIVGQVLALLLARERISVSLIASTRANQPDLRSFALNAASRQILMDLRVWPEKSGQATPVQRMEVFGDALTELSFDASEQPLAWIVDAADLQDRLTTAINFAPEIALLPAQGNSDAPDKASSAQLTVICEGRVSQTREATGALFEQFAYAQHAIAAHIICERPHRSTARQWMQTEQICAFLPRGESKEGNSVALVWSVSTERASQLLSFSQEAFVQELCITTHGHLGQIHLAGWPSGSEPQLGAGTKASAMASWPLALAQAKQWCGQASWGTWVLAGDAAHAVHPLAGQGLNLGLADAAALARALATKPYFRNFADMKLLRTYERARKSEAGLLRLVTDGLQQVFSSSDSRALGLRSLGMQSFQAAAPLKAWLMRRASGQN